MNLIEVNIIHPSSMRYPSAGDWIVQENQGHPRYVVDIAHQHDDDYAFLVAIHELCEAFLCRKRGIAEKAVSDFDIEYEKNRKEGDESEPGDAHDAPYRREHQFSELIERMIALEAGIDWSEYNDKLNA